MGIHIRGKYTLVIKFAFPTRLLDAWLNPLAKKLHGTSAAKLNIGYGIPSDGILASFPKNRLKTTIVKKG